MTASGTILRISAPDWRLVLDAARAGVLDSLTGTEFVFTGPLGLPRDQLQELVRVLGARTTETVTARSILVTNSTRATGKYKTARLLGATVLNESEFVRMMMPRSGVTGLRARIRGGHAR